MLLINPLPARVSSNSVAFVPEESPMKDFRFVVFPSISVVAAVLCTQNVLIPFYLRAFPSFVESVKGAEAVQRLANYTTTNFHYDPWTNHTINICFLSAFAGYWSMSIVSTILDILPLRQYKTQGSRSILQLRDGWRRFCSRT